MKFHIHDTYELYELSKTKVGLAIAYLSCKYTLRSMYPFERRIPYGIWYTILRISFPQ